MKKALTIGVVAVALAGTLSLVAARSRQAEPEPVATAEALPSSDILTSVLQMGLSPIGQPLRRGPYYLLHAYDRRGNEVLVVADAQLGDILDVTPVQPLVPLYEGGPRIIHVPQAGERDDDANSDERDEPAASDGDDAEQAAPIVPRAVPKPRKRSDAAPRRKLGAVPPPPVQRRAVLSAPPPSADRSLTPIYPTPRFAAPVEGGDKFAPPKESEVTASTPPVGYTPPAAPPQSDAPAPAPSTQADAPAPSTQPDDIH